MIRAMTKSEQAELITKPTEMQLTIRRTFNVAEFESLSIEVGFVVPLTGLGQGPVEPAVAADHVMPKLRVVMQKAYDDYVDAKGKPRAI